MLTLLLRCCCAAIVSSWATTDAAAQHEAVIAQLHQLKILESSSMKAKIQGVVLNATFKNSTQKAILHGYEVEIDDTLNLQTFNCIVMY